MYVPMELLSHILQDTLEICSLKDLWNLKAVNFLLPRQAKAFLMKRVSFHDDESELTYVLAINAEPRIRWKDLPHRIKCFYLYRQIQIHGQSQSAWSNLIQGILDLPNQRKTKETETLINQLIDVCLSVKFNRCGKLLDCDLYMADSKVMITRRVGVFYPSHEPFETALKYALATSEIQRGDCVQLQRVLDQGVRLTRFSDQLPVIPLKLAAETGSGAIIELLIAHGCPKRYRSYQCMYWDDDINVINTMAESGAWWDQHIVPRSGEGWGPSYGGRLSTHAIDQGTIVGHYGCCRYLQRSKELIPQSLLN